MPLFFLFSGPETAARSVVISYAALVWTVALLSLTQFFLFRSAVAQANKYSIYAACLVSIAYGLAVNSIVLVYSRVSEEPAANSTSTIVLNSARAWNDTSGEPSNATMGVLMSDRRLLDDSGAYAIGAVLCACSLAFCGVSMLVRREFSWRCAPALKTL